MIVLILFIVISGVIGLAWAVYQYLQLKKISLNNSFNVEDEMQFTIGTGLGVVEIGAIIQEGAIEFIMSEYKVCSCFVALMALVVYFCVDTVGCYTTFAFVMGAATSMLCGGFGMKIATFSNYRTTICAK